MEKNQTHIETSKRLAKNTILLYGRMLFSMLISLYTSRVALSALGFEDYGIYNVVGGLVALFTLISSSLTGAINRFLTFELGRGNQIRLSEVFSSAINIQLIFSMLIGIFSLLVGGWFLNNQMNIPIERLNAATFTLYCTILTVVLGLVNIPYNASIIAHEHMHIYAIVSIAETVLKAIVVILISFATYDRLKLYALLLAFIALFVLFTNWIYCVKKFPECQYRRIKNMALIKEMFSFSGWSFLGASASLMMSNGVNILINIFFGVVVNTARGIANQVDIALNQLVWNFTTALNPQITKSFAVNDKDYLFKLVFRGAKYSYFLLLVPAIPIILETDGILSIWLKDVPQYASLFLRLSLLISLLSVLSNTLVTMMLATGNIKKYQLIVGGLGLMVLPLVYIAYKVGAPPYASYIIQLIIFVVQLVCRLWLLKGMTQLSIRRYCKEVLLRIIPVTIVAFIIPSCVVAFVPYSLPRMFVVIPASIMLTILIIYSIGLTSGEKSFIKEKIRDIVKKKMLKQSNI